jgi:hypothetical protein
MPVRDLVNPVSTLFDAASRHESIRMDCPECRHISIFHAAGLWHLFSRKSWDDGLRDVSKHFYCRVCLKRGEKVVRPRVMTCPDEPTIHLPLPSNTEWKNAISRRR